MSKYYLHIFLSCILSSTIAAQQNDSTVSGIIDEELGKVDTNYFNVGKKKVEIIERNDSTYVNVWEETEEGDTKKIFEERSKDKDNRRFRGHWAGFEFGLNNYVDKDFSIARTPENEFMDINTNRSWNFNFNFAQYSLPLGTKYAGLVTGLGIEWSNYHFSNASTIVKNTNSQSIEYVLLNEDLILNRFRTTYLTVPLLLEVQFFGGSRKDRMYIAGGVIGGVKLASNTKIKYTEDGSKKRRKVRGDYYLRPFRYGITGRVGYKLLKVYLNYYPVPLFLDDRGPELYPVAMGFALTF